MENAVIMNKPMGYYLTNLHEKSSEFIKFIGKKHIKYFYVVSKQNSWAGSRLAERLIRTLIFKNIKLCYSFHYSLKDPKYTYYMRTKCQRFIKSAQKISINLAEIIPILRSKFERVIAPFSVIKKLSKVNTLECYQNPEKNQIWNGIEYLRKIQGNIGIEIVPEKIDPYFSSPEFLSAVSKARHFEVFLTSNSTQDIALFASLPMMKFVTELNLVSRSDLIPYLGLLKNPNDSYLNNLVSFTYKEYKKSNLSIENFKVLKEFPKLKKIEIHLQLVNRNLDVISTLQAIHMPASLENFHLKIESISLEKAFHSFNPKSFPINYKNLNYLHTFSLEIIPMLPSIDLCKFLHCLISTLPSQITNISLQCKSDSGYEEVKILNLFSKNFPQLKSLIYQAPWLMPFYVKAKDNQNKFNLEELNIGPRGCPSKILEESKETLKKLGHRVKIYSDHEYTNFLKTLEIIPTLSNLEVLHINLQVEKPKEVIVEDLSDAILEMISGCSSLKELSLKIEGVDIPEYFLKKIKEVAKFQTGLLDVSFTYVFKAKNISIQKLPFGFFESSI